MRIRIFIIACFAGFLFSPLAAQETGARWELSSDRGVIGESLVLTLEVHGADKFDPPRLSVPGVEIAFQGGGPRNSTSIMSVNGKTTTTVTKAWIGSWGLKSAAEGRYRIDPVSLNIAGQIVDLPALDWVIGPAQNDNRFVLKQSLNQDVCIPGIELEYTLTWYIGESAQNPEFTIPILDNPDLLPVESSFKDVPAAGGDLFKMQYHGRELTWVKSLTQQGGKAVTTLSIRFRIKPAKPGTYDLSGTMVSFEGAVSTRQEQDFFGNVINQPVYSTLAAKAPPLKLLVKDLPSKGRPDPFSGLIGKLDLKWDAGLSSYSVGEPIPLTLILSGVLNKPDLDLDHMVITALNGGDFQVSGDLSAKETEGQRSYVFRARHSGRLTIPSLTLNYFDPKTERYGQTASKPLTFDIKDSLPPAGTANVGVQGGAQASTQSAGQTPSTGTPADGSAPVNLSASGAMMNPNGLKRSFWPSVPWWAFGLPPLLFGIILSVGAYWKYSPRRLTALERKAWLKKICPIKASGGREALEEGRERINSLLITGEHWKERLRKNGHWDYLQKQAALWDESFFADSRDNEHWVVRWDELCTAMEAWK